MRIGGHVSAAGGIHQAVPRAQAIRANCGQIFFTGPTSWRSAQLKASIAEQFTTACGNYDIRPWVAHAVYLINLASADERIWNNSIQSLVLYRTLGLQTGLSGIVLHTGSHGGAGLASVLPRVVAGLEAVLSRQPEGPPLLLEICAGQGGAIGVSFPELGQVIKALGNDTRLGVCLDTCHALAAGYDVRTVGGSAAMLDELDRSLGVERLRAIHANDSQFDLASHRDRHANIGEGFIGEAGFTALLAHDVLRSLPWILETPGTDGSGPDLDNINRLRRLAGEALVPDSKDAASSVP
ncbi:MAG: deoxyribonuclease IV [Chloroflexi bacterium]|nr:deoxyribonuclease IV [Chloroflexota bacterium]